jgi:CubicO group peptidase (beta-lactamase class C family)
MRKLLFLLFLLPFALPAQQQPAFITDSLDTYISREMAGWNLPGLAIAIVKDGKVVVSKGYGVTEIGTDKKVNDETLFQVASCSKAFTATSLALLAQQKKLSLEDTVTRYIPFFKLYDPLATKQTTIRDLLCHRLGLQTFQGDFLNWDSNLSRKQVIEQLAREKPVYGFRAQYGYCNAAFLTAGEIIPVVTGQSWDAFIKSTFFDPLEMKRSSTTYAAIKSDANAARPHSKWEGKEIVIPYDNIDNLGPAGSVNSCVKDFSHWLLMQLDSGRFNGKQVVPFSVLQETRRPNMIIPGTPALFPGMHFQTYGLGWYMADFYGKKVIWHNGGAGGFLSTTFFVPELNLGGVVFTNSDNNNLYNALRYQILDAYLGLPYRNYSAIYRGIFAKNDAKADQEIAGWKYLASKNPALPAAAKNFAGVYENPVYGKMMVTVDGNKIGASFEHHPMMFAKLEFIGDSAFLCTFNSPLWGITKAPFVLKDGKVQSITISVSDNVDMLPYLFRKVE